MKCKECGTELKPYTNQSGEKKLACECCGRLEDVHKE